MIKTLIDYVKEDDYLISVFKNKIHVFGVYTIIDYTSSNIILKLNNEIIKIYGTDLIINKYEKKEILITGIFKRMEK
ncbi:MAG: YabP/YqfC family sporulation protein [Bacilli bacterium]